LGAYGAAASFLGLFDASTAIPAANNLVLDNERSPTIILEEPVAAARNIGTTIAYFPGAAKRLPKEATFHRGSRAVPKEV